MRLPAVPVAVAVIVVGRPMRGRVVLVVARAGCGAGRMMVRAGGTVDRQAFGLRFDVPGVGKLVPRQLRLEIDVDVLRV